MESPKGELQFIRYFCGNTEIPTDLQERKPIRAALYKATVALVRAYANIADDLEKAGYDADGVSRIKRELNYYLDLRETIRKASGESLELKAYEADMRHLIDTYIEADEPRKISPFDDIGLLDLIVKTGIADAIASRLGGLKGDKNAIAETIENNVRSKIVKERLNDPNYYDTMSSLLNEIIAARKANAIEYEEFLKKIAALAKDVAAGHSADTPPELDTPGRRALYSNLLAGSGNDDGFRLAAEKVDEKSVFKATALKRALSIDEAVKRVRPDGWRGVRAKELIIKAAIYGILEDQNEVERIFLVIKAQREY